MSRRPRHVVLAVSLFFLTSFPHEAPGAVPPVLPRRVDRYGDALPPRAKARLGTVRFRHGGGVYCAFFSPDGKALTSFGEDDAFRTWAVPSGRETRQRRRRGGRPEWFSAAAFSADGKLLALGGGERGQGDRPVFLYDSSTGKELRRFTIVEAGYWVSAVALSPDGKLLAAGDCAGRIHVWQTATGKKRYAIDWDRAMVTALAFSPDGRLLASGSGLDAVCLWDARTGKRVEELQRRGPGDVSKNSFRACVAFSPDGKLLATANSDGSVRLWDVRTGKVVRRLAERDEDARDDRFQPSNGLAFSPDGKRLAVDGWDDILRLWEVAGGKLLRRIDLRRQRSGWSHGTTLAFSPDRTVLASWAGESAVRLWDTRTGTERNATDAHRGSVHTIAFSPGGRTLATGGDAMAVRLWEKNGKPVRSWLGPMDRAALSLAFSPDGTRLACAGDSQAVRQCRLPTGRPLLPSLRTEHGPPAEALAFAPDGCLLAATGSDSWTSGTVYLWDTRTGEGIGRFPTDCAHCVAFSPDGSLLAAGGGTRVDESPPFPTGVVPARLSPPPGYNGSITVWDSQTHKVVCRLETAGSMVRGVAFTGPQTLVSANDDGMLRLWEVTPGQERRRWKGSKYVATSPDGRLVASAGEGTDVRVWDLGTGQFLARLRGHRGVVRALAFSPDGRTLASASEDTTALLWDLSGLPTPRRRARPLSRRQLEALWHTLGDEEASGADRAIRALAAVPEQAIPLIRKRLPPVNGDPARVRRLVAELDAEVLARRQSALGQLEQLGEAARPVLHRTLAGGAPLEQHLRIKALLRKPAWATQTSEGRRAARAVEVLVSIGTPQAARTLEVLANGAPKAWLTREAQSALKRLAKRPPSD